MVWRKPTSRNKVNLLDTVPVRSEQIKTEWEENQHIICPHTACGEKVRRSYYADEPHSVVVATAHPAKFETIVEPLIDKTIPIPEKLYEIMRKPSKAKEIGTDYHQLFE